MPKDAYISEATLVKSEVLQQILKKHMETHIAKYGLKDPYLVVDMCAGDGWNGALPGSFLTIHKMMKDLKLVNWHLVGFEKDTTRMYPSLITEVGKLDQSDRKRITTYGDDNIKVRPSIIKWGTQIRGLLYDDPIGTFHHQSLSMVSREFPNMDILINSNCSQIKRTAGIDRVKNHLKHSLQEMLGKINKKYWLIGERRAKQQWCFIYGTNDLSTLPNMGDTLLRIDDNDVGTLRFNKVNLTADKL